MAEILDIFYLKLDQALDSASNLIVKYQVRMLYQHIRFIGIVSMQDATSVDLLYYSFVTGSQ